MTRVLELPNSCLPFIVITILATLLAVYLVAASEHASLVLAIAAVFASGFLADLITAFVHFGLDYAVPSYRVPILGPMSREFQEHHDNPTQSPSNSNYGVNFTKGAYGSFPVLIPVIIFAWNGTEGVLSFFVLATLTGMSVWALFVNQIHAFTHMGSDVSSEEFSQWTERIKNLPTETEQRREYDRLFENIPIPRAVRVLQGLGVILSPSAHNMHHINFEKNFGIINGWSNPISNLVLVPISRHFKQKGEKA